MTAVVPGQEPKICLKQEGEDGLTGNRELLYQSMTQ